MSALDKLAPPLRYILDMELAAGNKVIEVSVEPGWPPGCELFIGLNRKFRKSYKLTPDTVFRLVDDYHYWFAEYDFQNGLQMLICGFSEPM